MKDNPKEEKSFNNPLSPGLFEAYIKKVVPGLIKHLESTKDSDWVEDITLSKDKKKYCIINHMITHFESGGIDLEIFFTQTRWDQFFLFQVNDGNLSIVYPGETPKERCLNLFRGLLSNPHTTRAVGIIYLTAFQQGVNYVKEDKHGQYKNKK